MNCYNCRKEISENENHSEHIPAKNLYSTYEIEYKKNLLKVPCCYDCNNSFSKIDQEIRDAIGILNKNNEMQSELTIKSVKSILRSKDGNKRIEFLDEKNQFQVSFNYDDFQKLHVKNFKGLFYNKYGFPFPDNFVFDLISEGDEKDEKSQRVKEQLNTYLDLNHDWSIVGHKDIFKYKIKAMIPNKNGVLYDGMDFENSISFVCKMEYHNIIKPLLFINRTDFITN